MTQSLKTSIIYEEGLVPERPCDCFCHEVGGLAGHGVQIHTDKCVCNGGKGFSG